jgi:hypothetical protein
VGTTVPVRAGSKLLHCCTRVCSGNTDRGMAQLLWKVPPGVATTVQAKNRVCYTVMTLCSG